MTSPRKIGLDCKTSTPEELQRWVDRLNRKAIFYSRSWSAARARTFQTIRITHNYAAWGSKIDYETLYLYLYEKTASDPITRLVSTQNIEILRNFALALTTEDYDPEVYELLVKRLSDLGCVFDSRQSIDWEVLNLDEPYLLVAWCMIIAKKGNASWSHYTRTGNAAIWPQQVEVGSRALVLFSRPLPETEDPYEVQQYLDRWQNFYEELLKLTRRLIRASVYYAKRSTNK